MKTIKAWLKTLAQKLSSRKFLMALGGVLSGILLLRDGSTTEGAALLGTSILGYLVAEGYVDGKAAAAAAETVSAAAAQVVAVTSGSTQTTAAAVEAVALAAADTAESAASEAQTSATTTVDTAALANALAAALKSTGVTG